MFPWRTGLERYDDGGWSWLSQNPPWGRSQPHRPNAAKGVSQPPRLGRIGPATEGLNQKGFTAHIRSRGEEAQAIKKEAGFKARRWVVERLDEPGAFWSAGTSAAISPEGVKQP